MASNLSGGMVDLLSLIPKCGSCLEDFDTFLHSPQILPCCHTFCLMCISKEKQRKKRRCALCKEKYSRFLVNTAYLVLIARVHAQRRLEERSSVRCEECDKRLPIMSMRRCATCEHEIRKIVAHPHQTCCVCLECCVDRHNGHELHRIIASGNVSKGTRLPQMSQSQPRQQVFVRRTVCGGGARSSPSTGVTSAASSSSGSNPGSHQSTLRTNRERFEREESSDNSHITYSTVKMNNTVGSVQFAKLIKRLDGLRKLSEKEPLDFGASLESALSCIENTEYFRRGDIESGFCSPMANSADAENTIRVNDVSEHMLTTTKVHEASDDTRCSSNSSTPRSHVPNMPRRNRSRGGPNPALFVHENSTDSEGTRLENEILPIMVRASKIDGRINEKPHDHDRPSSDNKQLCSSSSQTPRFTTREQRFGVQSEYFPPRGNEAGKDDHEYENFETAIKDEVVAVASLHNSV